MRNKYSPETIAYAVLAGIVALVLLFAVFNKSSDSTVTDPTVVEETVEENVEEEDTTSTPKDKTPGQHMNRW